jgi:hypothetical protein
VSGAWPWLAIALLGAYHGIDPSMGWLFAVALGLQERRRSKVVAALLPIAVGHLLSIAAVVALIIWARGVAASGFLRAAGAGALFLFGVFKFIKPRAHPRWVAMKVNSRELATWSFLMATAHGAGLMLFPILMGMPAAHPGMMHSCMPYMPSALGRGAASLAQGSAIVLLHTAAMLLVMGSVAILVYDRLGLAVLRSAWVNLDTLWAGALVAAGVLSFVL